MTLEPLESWDLGKTWGTFTSGTFHGSIRGVEIQKSDDDLERYRELVEISQPDIVIETGTRRGGSALYLHHDLGLQVVTIDIAPTFDNGKVPWHANSGIRSLVGSSVKPEIISEVLPLIRGKRVMVSLDSDHHSAHVQAEMRVWGQFVSPGCYMVVEDACFDLFDRFGQPDWARVGGYKIPEVGGPLHAMEAEQESLQRYFWRDEALEGLTDISHSPCGWWRKHE